MDHLLIRDARLIDGTGAPWVRGDLRIRQGRIAAIGNGLAPEGAEVIEAAGDFLAPGFIDAHCHDDLVQLREPDRVEKVYQGVTTVVVGNCSFSLYPAPRAARKTLAAHFGALLGETAEDEVFADFRAYEAALASGAALNTVSLVGHGALRLAVMGGADREASVAEVAAMVDLLATQLAQGAHGLSLGLVYPPSAYAGRDELLALARVVQAQGRLLTAHIRSYEGGLLAATDEFLDLLKVSGAAGLLSHLQSAGRPNWGQVPRVIQRLQAARASGVEVTFDMYPYPAGSTYLLQLLPPEALAGGLPALVARLADPGERAALRHWVEASSGDPHRQSKVALIGWENVRLSAVGAPALKQVEGLSMQEGAARLGLTPFDLMARLIDEDRGQTGIVLFQLDEADLRAACTHPLHCACSDGLPRPGARPHPRGFGSFARFAGHLVREGWFPVEDAVRRMTSAPARRFGLNDRGLLRPGLVADLVLFGEGIADPANFDAPMQLATGVRHVFVAGTPVLAEGKATGHRPGRLLRAS
jgi:N-acyl-D-amino-acid deacylase